MLRTDNEWLAEDFERVQLLELKENAAEEDACGHCQSREDIQNHLVGTHGRHLQKRSERSHHKKTEQIDHNILLEK